MALREPGRGRGRSITVRGTRLRAPQLDRDLIQRAGPSQADLDRLRRERDAARSAQQQAQAQVQQLQQQLDDAIAPGELQGIVDNVIAQRDQQWLDALRQAGIIQ